MQKKSKQLNLLSTITIPTPTNNQILNNTKQYTLTLINYKNSSLELTSYTLNVIKINIISISFSVKYNYLNIITQKEDVDIKENKLFIFVKRKRK
jgi:hypothetical protein